jgi:energy-coupling factor transporter transmembrane protein EcfT
VVALIVLLLILALFGGLGFAAHFLWFVLIAAVILWLIGFLSAASKMRLAEGGGGSAAGERVPCRHVGSVAMKGAPGCGAPYGFLDALFGELA